MPMQVAQEVYDLDGTVTSYNRRDMRSGGLSRRGHLCPECVSTTPTSAEFMPWFDNHHWTMTSISGVPAMNASTAELL